MERWKKGMYINRHDCWESYWKDKVTVDGEFDIEQIKQELFEYQILLEQLQKNTSSYKLSRTLSKGVQHIVNEIAQKSKEKPLEQECVPC